MASRAVICGRRVRKLVVIRPPADSSGWMSSGRTSSASSISARTCSLRFSGRSPMTSAASSGSISSSTRASVVLSTRSASSAWSSVSRLAMISAESSGSRRGSSVAWSSTSSSSKTSATSTGSFRLSSAAMAATTSSWSRASRTLSSVSSTVGRGSVVMAAPRKGAGRAGLRERRRLRRDPRRVYAATNCPSSWIGKPVPLRCASAHPEDQAFPGTNANLGLMPGHGVGRRRAELGNEH